MPLKCAHKVRYRMKMQGGHKMRMAFCGDRVIETKNMDTGATHTQSEFARDKKRKGRRKKKK